MTVSKDEFLNFWNCPMDEYGEDAGVDTLGEYFTKLLLAVWDENEGFSGKRPFGNSGWTIDVYYTIAKNGLVKATYDPDWGDYDYDTEEADDYIRNMLSCLPQFGSLL